jgi:class 3 adenylate cyclase/predicted ATPase
MLFCDLVGSTAMSKKFDPEDMRDLLSAYINAVIEVVARFQGYVAECRGDSVLAFFGYPVAREDDAERALRAAFAAVERVSSLTAPDGQRPQARVGVATGIVVVGGVFGDNLARLSAIGDTPNLAARLQTLARPGSVVISANTHRLVGNLFECEDLGTHELKGFSEPVQAWRAIGERIVTSRFEALHPGGFAPLVGREEEVRLLLQRWEQAKEGDGQVVLLAGEPGIGKSRLVQALRDETDGEECLRLQYFCSPRHQNSAFHPVIELLERAAGMTSDDSPEDKIEKLRAVFMRSGSDLDTVVPLAAGLMSIPCPTLPAVPPRSAMRQRDEVREALLGHLFGLAARWPVLAIFEDVHWIDPSSVELLECIIERAQAHRILVVITSRPEAASAWIGSAQVTLLALNRLSRRQSAAIVENLSGNTRLSKAMVTSIVARADGIPLFVEELARTILERAADEEQVSMASDSRHRLPVPATLHDSLMARLDRSPLMKEVAQIGSAIGREFSYPVLASVAHLPAERLDEGLDLLVRSGLVFRLGAPPDAVYSFKHSLVQDAAYGTMLRVQRQHLHERIAQVLEESYPVITAEEPECLAHHLAAAGKFDQAARYCLAAGQRAYRRSANTEAINHLDEGLGHLPKVQDPRTRMEIEAGLQAARGLVLSAVKGYAHPQVEEAYERARHLMGPQTDTHQIFPVLFGLSELHCVRGKIDLAAGLAGKLLSLAEGVGEPDLRMVAHTMLGTYRWYMGENAESERHLTEAIAVYDPAQHARLAEIYGHDLGVAALSFLALNHWVSGRPARSLEATERALALARRINQPASLCFAMVLNQSCLTLANDAQTILRRADECIALSSENGFSYWLSAARIYRGWALARLGQPETGIADLEQGTRGWQATGADPSMTWYLAILSDAYLAGDRVEDALDAARQAARMIQQSSERQFAALVDCVLAKALLALPKPGVDEAEACCRRAIATARGQGAAGWELRATLILSRLLARSGRGAEAAKRLREAMAGITQEDGVSLDVRAAAEMMGRIEGGRAVRRAADPGGGAPGRRARLVQAAGSS